MADVDNTAPQEGGRRAMALRRTAIVAIVIAAASGAVAVASGELPPVPGIGGGETDVSPAEEAFGSLLDDIGEARGTRPILITKGSEFCLEASDGGACGTVEDLLAGELYYFDYCGRLPVGHTRVAGAMMDGVDSVEILVQGSGASVTAPVEANIYDIQVSGVADTLRWTQNGQTETREIAKPSDLNLDNCLPPSEFQG